MLEVEPTG